MSDLLTREYAEIHDVEVSGDGRTLTLACVPYMTPATVDDGQGPYQEQFARGAFAVAVKAPNRVALHYWHQRSRLPFGFGQSLREDAKYLVGDFRVAKSADGDQLLALVDDGLKGVSVGYLPDPRGDVRQGGVITRTRVKVLGEVSLTPAPAYAGAEVLAVREESVPQSLSAAAIERERLYWTRIRLGG